MNNKILFYIELPPPMHGMTYINQIIYDNFKHREHYSFYDTNFTMDVSEVGNVSFNKIVKNISIMLGAWRAFFKYKPKSVYSIVSATKYGIIRDFAILIPAFLAKKKLVLHLHGFTYYKIYQTSKLYKFIFDVLSKNAVIIVLCERQKSKTLEIMGKSSVVLYNCIDKKVVTHKKTKNSILQICYISNISREKGALDLIEAVKKYQSNIRLIIAGNFLGDKEEFLESIKGRENISFVGFADEKTKNSLFESSDIFCLPSKLEEGSPISIIEAMSYGLPILATDKGCIREMIDGCGYLLSENYSDNNILDGIEFIDNNYEALSINVFEKFQQHYSQEKFIGNFANILQGEK